MVGFVLSDKMNKTRNVIVLRRKMHKKYGKILSVTKKYAVHDELNQSKKGDKIAFKAARRISKTKSHELLEVLQRTSVQYETPFVLKSPLVGTEK
jgi:small subunit ribosomal protein S17